MRNPFGYNRRSLLEPEEDEVDFSSLLGGFEEEEEPMEMMQTPPMRQSYLDELGKAPKMEDFRPSTGRSILSALAGGLAGLGNPQRGMEIGESIVRQPYERAAREHKTRLEPLAKSAEVEEGTIKEQQESLKQRLARAKEKNKYIVTVAREQSMHQKRLADIENMKDDNKREEAKARETERYHKAIEKHRAGMLSLGHTKENNLQKYRATKEQRLRDKSAGSADKPLPAGEQQKIRQMALEEVSRDERFTRFYNPDAKAFQNGVIEGNKVTEEMDEETEALLKQAIAYAEERIAKKNRNQYMIDRVTADPFGDFLDEDEDEEEEEE